MSNDFLNSPSRTSYRLKLVLAALTLLALVVAWYARSGVVDKTVKLAANNATMQADLSALQTELDGKVSAVAETEKSLAENQAALSSLTAQVDQLTTDLGAANEQLSAAQTESGNLLAASDEKIAALQLQLDEGGTALGKLETRLEQQHQAARQANLDAQMKRDELETLVAGLQEQLTEKDNELQAALAASQSGTDQAQASIQSLTGDLEARTAESEA
ncbi:MAG: hypothetical protein KTR33_07060, partial [Gammaproteobacteria bacterium]|nr:hypothetical protein [Gammaproteobacteria bacterium]